MKNTSKQIKKKLKMKVILGFDFVVNLFAVFF